MDSGCWQPGAHRAPPTGGGDVVPTDAVFTIDDPVTSLTLPKSTLCKLARERKDAGRKVGKLWRF